MKFPNAFNGVKRLFTAEILEIIAIVVGAIAAIAGVFAYGADQTGHQDVAGNAALVAVIVGVVAGIVLLAAAIISFLGLNDAAKDEPEFKNAVTAVIVSFALAIVGSILPESAKGISSILDSASTVISVYVTYTVIKGISNLSSKLNNRDMVERGVRLVKYIIIAAVLGIVAELVQSLWIKDPKANLNVILSIAVMAFGLFRGIAYIVYLSKAKKMLQNA